MGLGFVEYRVEEYENPFNNCIRKRPLYQTLSYLLILIADQVTIKSGCLESIGIVFFLALALSS